MAEPRILFFDIESAGVNALKSDLGFVICFGYKWAGAKKAHVLVIDEAGLRRFDDSRLLKQLSILMTQADLVVGHFASVFDRRFINGRLLINRLPPIPQTKMRDTCMIARSVANFSSNRLKHLAERLHLKNQKHESKFPDWWFDTMRGDRKALKKMASYCKGDVLALEELYFRLRPFDNAHPRIQSDRAACPVCGGDITYRGVAYVGHHFYRRFRCQKCGKWDRERNRVKV